MQVSARVTHITGRIIRIESMDTAEAWRSSH